MQEPMSGSTKAVVLIVGVIVLATAVFFFSKDPAPVEAPVVEERPTTQESPTPGADSSEGVPTTPPEGMTENNAEEVPPPPELPQETEDKINAITKRYDAGEITLEEAQEQINKILGI